MKLMTRISLKWKTFNNTLENSLMASSCHITTKAFKTEIHPVYNFVLYDFTSQASVAEYKRRNESLEEVQEFMVSVCQ